MFATMDHIPKTWARHVRTSVGLIVGEFRVIGKQQLLALTLRSELARRPHCFIHFPIERVMRLHQFWCHGQRVVVLGKRSLRVQRANVEELSAQP